MAHLKCITHEKRCIVFEKTDRSPFPLGTIVDTVHRDGSVCGDTVVSYRGVDYTAGSVFRAVRISTKPSGPMQAAIAATRLGIDLSNTPATRKRGRKGKKA